MTINLDVSKDVICNFPGFIALKTKFLFQISAESIKYFCLIHDKRYFAKNNQW